MGGGARADFPCSPGLEGVDRQTHRHSSSSCQSQNQSQNQGQNQSQSQSQSQPEPVSETAERTVVLSNGANIRGAHRWTGAAGYYAGTVPREKRWGATTAPNGPAD